MRLARVGEIVDSEPVFPRRAATLYSRDRRAALVAAYARAGISEARWRTAAQQVAERLSAVPGTAAGGSALGTTQVNRQVQRDLTHAEELAFPILFVLALVVFGSGVAALLPLVCGGLTILGALLMLRLLDGITPISTYALNIVTGAGLGLAIDYSLLLVSRYREELARQGAGAAAVRTTVATAGRTVAFSSVTVGVAIATLTVFPLGFLRSMGIAGALVGPLAGVVSLAVLPPLFDLLGPRVNALRGAQAARVDPAGAGSLVPACTRADAAPRPGCGRRLRCAHPRRAPVHVDPVHRDRCIGAAGGRQLASRRRCAPFRVPQRGRLTGIRGRRRQRARRRGVCAVCARAAGRASRAAAAQARSDDLGGRGNIRPAVPPPGLAAARERYARIAGRRAGGWRDRAVPRPGARSATDCRSRSGCSAS